MKATHIDYKHKGHLRVVTGEKYSAYNMMQGLYEEEALCVSPNSDLYKSLYNSNSLSMKVKYD